MKRIEPLPKSNENEWAMGCKKCSHGLVSPPERSGACELYLERLVQAIDGDLHFCTCRAGAAYRANLLNRFEFLKREAKKDARMATFAQRGSHPDIEAARSAMQSSYAYVKAPPIRWIDAAQPPETEIVAAAVSEEVTPCQSQK